MSQCSFCDNYFRTDGALHAHCRDKADHPYCISCQRLFSSFGGLDQHLQNAGAHRDESSYLEPEEGGVAAHRHCVSCNRYFVDQQALFTHLANSSSHNWCFMCSRDFSSPQALNQHSSSRVHDIRNFSCPFCSSTFNVPSAIAHHIESGCHKITRHQVTAAVHKAVKSFNIQPTISLSHRIGYGLNPQTVTTYTATSAAFNGTAYECYLCHRTFGTLPGLNAHLASPAHDVDEFGCPKCKKHFTVVSALVQHIESEVCGVAKFKEVDDYAAALTDRFTRLLKL